jgi:hypothetical protein
MSRLNSDFSVEISFSEMTPPLREAAPRRVAGGACVHDARTRPATAAATPADRNLRQVRQETRITNSLSLAQHQHDTTTTYGANAYQTSWLPRSPGRQAQHKTTTLAPHLGQPRRGASPDIHRRDTS